MVSTPETESTLAMEATPAMDTGNAGNGFNTGNGVNTGNGFDTGNGFNTNQRRDVDKPAKRNATVLSKVLRRRQNARDFRRTVTPEDFEFGMYQEED
ncbi:hypothetical protein DL770_008105 [Monosporascus sp. CRB-9-2]|nr:hypothetical protein DL770_008105 [Monosporascus sp. CRB-9-2]